MHNPDKISTFAKSNRIRNIKSITMDQLENIQNHIYVIRGQRVMLDFDLAAMYGVETRRLNEQVKRNIERFPEDFMFQLTKGEFEILKSQNVISNSWISQNATSNNVDNQMVTILKSQNATSMRALVHNSMP